MFANSRENKAWLSAIIDRFPGDHESIGEANWSWSAYASADNYKQTSACAYESIAADFEALALYSYLSEKHPGDRFLLISLSLG